MTKVAKQNNASKPSLASKIIAIILIILIAFVVVSVIALFILSAVFDDVANIALSAKRAGITKEIVFKTIDDFEYNYDNVLHFDNKYKSDKYSLFDTTDDFSKLNSLISSFTDNISSNQLATFLFESYNKHMGIEGLFALFDYLDFGKIDKIKQYKIVKFASEKLKEFDGTLPTFKENLPRTEWNDFSFNLYNLLLNITNAQPDLALTYANQLKSMLKANSVLEEIPVKDIANVVNYSGSLLNGTKNPVGTTKVIAKMFFNDKNIWANALVNCPTMLENCVHILENITIHDVAYRILGDYPYLERVANNIFYVLKEKIDARDYPTIASEFEKFAHATFDKEKYWSEQLLLEMIDTSRNIDVIDFTVQEREFWETHTYHYFERKARA